MFNGGESKKMVSLLRPLTYLIQTKETKLLHNTDCTNTRSTDNLSCHLESDLHNFKRIGEHDL